MSADEFDPAIERLFAQTPRQADDGLFLATFQARLEKRSRWRRLTLTAAGLIGGALAVREGVNVNLTENGDAVLSQGMRAAAVAAQGAAQNRLDALGVGGLDLTGGSGMLAFWIAAGAAAALLAAGAVRLSQDV